MALLALPVAGLPALTACASATIEDAVPQAALAGEAPETAAGADTMARPRRTGRYPNLNMRQQAAAEQISDAQKARLIEELSVARERQGDADAGAAAAEAARLRQLAATHGETALEQIEQTE